MANDCTALGHVQTCSPVTAQPDLLQALVNGIETLDVCCKVWLQGQEALVAPAKLFCNSTMCIMGATCHIALERRGWRQLVYTDVGFARGHVCPIPRRCSGRQCHWVDPCTYRASSSRNAILAAPRVPPHGLHPMPETIEVHSSRPQQTYRTARKSSR